MVESTGVIQKGLFAERYSKCLHHTTLRVPYRYPKSASDCDTLARNVIHWLRRGEGSQTHLDAGGAR